MSHVYGLLKDEQSRYYDEEYDSIPITCEEYLIQRHNGINFYLIELGDIDWNRIHTIVKACEEVENQCWKAQENFFDYLKKCDVLSYAEKDGRIIAFDAVSRMISNGCCVYNNEETMVLKEFRGQNIAQQSVWGTIEWHLTKSSYLDGVRDLAYTSISANPIVVNLYYNKSMWAWIRRIADCSFKPSARLKELVREYCQRQGIALVNEEYPFCLKNVFPGSNRFDPNDPRYQFCDKVREHMPPEFEHMARGDAFAYMFRVPVKVLRVVNMVTMYLFYGKTYLSREGLGLFSPKVKKAPKRTEAWPIKKKERPVLGGIIHAQEEPGRRVSVS